MEIVRVTVVSGRPVGIAVEASVASVDATAAALAALAAKT